MGWRVPTLVIVNLRARRIAQEPALLASLRRLPARVVATSTLEELDDATRRYGVDAGRVVLVGGDGSHMAGLSRLAAAGPLPEIALVAGGTVGTASRALGSKGRVVEEVTRALDAPASSASETVGVALDDGTPRVCFTFGAGLVSGFFEQYEAGPRGIAAAASLALRISLGAPLGTALATRALATVPAELDVDGRTLPGQRYSLILASALRDVGLGVKVTYRAGERPDRVHVVASCASPTALALASPNALLGRPLGGAGAFDDLVATLGVTFPTPTRVVLDGDTFVTTHAIVTPGPTLRLVRADR